MRTVMWTVFLVVALQGIATASTAFASPIEGTPSASTVSDVSTPAARPDAEPPKADSQPAMSAERKQAGSRPQVLSKNFQRPRPVQIYWFFGGR